MASKIVRTEPGVTSFAPDVFERAMAFAAMVLLIFLIAALARGRSEWQSIPFSIWLHLSTITVALALTPVMLLRRRGDILHRKLGWLWSMAMLLTAIDSLFISTINPGRFSFIHILSVWTILQVPIIVWSARTHNIVRHRGSVRGMVLGALLIAGFFTFPFNRLLGHWLFG